MEFFNYPAPLCIVKNFLPEMKIRKLVQEFKTIHPNLKREDNRRELFLNDHPQLTGNNVLTSIYEKIIESDLSRHSWVFQYLGYHHIPTTCVNLFENGEGYDYHRDDGVISIIYFLTDGEFKGGDFYINHVKIHIENNSVVIFPSCIANSIKPVDGTGCLWTVRTLINLKTDVKYLPFNIIRFNNFLSPEEWKYTQDIIRDNRNWAHTERSNRNPLLSKLWNIDLSHIDFFTKHLFNKIPNGPWKLTRVYANGQTYGQDGGFHQDSPDDKDWTFLLYTNEIEPDMLSVWGGETEFITNMGHNILLQPQPNSAVLFKADIFHRGRGPSKFVNDLRVTIAWKLTKLELDEEDRYLPTTTQ